MTNSVLISFFLCKSFCSTWLLRRQTNRKNKNNLTTVNCVMEYQIFLLYLFFFFFHIFYKSKKTYSMIMIYYFELLSVLAGKGKGAYILGPWLELIYCYVKSRNLWKSRFLIVTSCWVGTNVLLSPTDD